MCSTVFGASPGYVSISNVPFGRLDNEHRSGARGLLCGTLRRGIAGQRRRERNAAIRAQHIRLISCSFTDRILHLSPFL